MPAPVILSPHPDDAVLSLWHLLAAPGGASVLTVFNGPAEGTTTLGWWDRLTRAGDAAERAATRADEDRQALALVGAEPVELGFVDGQYRDGEQPLEPLVAAIEANSPPDSELLAPAALDRHRDHLAVRAAALELHNRGRRVAFYADVPHANVHGWPAWVTGGRNGASAEPQEFLDPEVLWTFAFEGSGIDLAGLQPQVHRLDDAQDAAKRDAIGRYRTQLPALEAQFAMLTRPEVLRYEVTWPLP
jgi:LmbE family N-acetylglucosaminyl deacetylase